MDYYSTYMVLTCDLGMCTALHVLFFFLSIYIPLDEGAPAVRSVRNQRWTHFWRVFEIQHEHLFKYQWVSG